ncbi:MAG: 6-carboxytetrahydropterin synthase QueD [Planctomycetota bacterium]
MATRLIRKFDFHAAHHLPAFPEGHACRRVHGHTYACEVVLEGDIDPATGLLMEFDALKRVIAPVEARLDHAMLNEIEGLENPTTELLARWVYQQLKPGLPALQMVRLFETPRNGVEYTEA